MGSIDNPALWTMVIIAGLVGWSPDRTSNLRGIVSLIETDWKSDDIIYHSSGLTAGLFRYYMPEYNHFPDQ